VQPPERFAGEDSLLVREADRDEEEEGEDEEEGEWQDTSGARWSLDAL
jgi:hypothetical protein